MEHPENYGVAEGKYSFNANSFTELKNRLSSFDYSSLSFKQQKTYDEINSYLDGQIANTSLP